MTAPYGIPYERLSLSDLHALPIGIIRDFRLGNVYVRCQKTTSGWKVLKRFGVPSHALADTLSAPFDPRRSAEETASSAPLPIPVKDEVARIADRYPID